MVMDCLYFPMNMVLVVENVDIMVLNFCAELFLRKYAVLIREEFMASEAGQSWS